MKVKGSSSPIFMDDDDRFHGSGLQTHETEMLDILDQARPDINAQNLKKLLVRLERCLQTNQELRSKYTDPLKYLDSEVELAEAIVHLNASSAAPQLYPLLVSLNGPQTILSLVTHDNTDISLSAISLLNELIDEESSQISNHSTDLMLLVDDLCKLDLLSLLVSNISRFDESIGDEMQGVFNTLSIFENLVSIDPSLALRVCSETSILNWLVLRINAKDFDSVKLYSSELLNIFLLSSFEVCSKLASMNVMEQILVVVAQYRKRDPVDAEETEFFENVFSVLCLLLSHQSAQAQFLDCQGLELMLILIKQKKMAKMRAFKVLDHALLGATKDSCTRFVDILGLKTIFPAILKPSKSYKKAYPDLVQKDQDEHLISILNSLCGNLTGEYHSRLISKFCENDNQKLIRLVQLFDQYQNKALQYELVSKETDAESLYMGRLDQGLHTLQLLGIILLKMAISSPHLNQKLCALLEPLGYDLETLSLIVQGISI